MNSGFFNFKSGKYYQILRNNNKISRKIYLTGSMGQYTNSAASLAEKNKRIKFAKKAFRPNSMDSNQESHCFWRKGDLNRAYYQS